MNFKRRKKLFILSVILLGCIFKFSNISKANQTNEMIGSIQTNGTKSTIIEQKRNRILKNTKIATVENQEEVGKESQEIAIKASREQLEVGETTILAVNSSSLPMAAIDLQIFYDEDKLEFVSGPELLAREQNQIRYSWFDEAGGESNLLNREILAIEFKVKENGITNIGISGIAYDKYGKVLQTNWQGVELKIGEEKTEEQTVIIEGSKSLDTNPSNAYLQNLRLNEEGLQPEFKKDIFDYYFLAGEQIEDLEVTAIPANLNSTVEVTGNKKIKIGTNEIKIEVISEDKTQKNEYKIYITKTNDFEKANANLENLAIENQILNPEFEASMTAYSIEVKNSLQELNILAIPENIKATVTIQGGRNLAIGNNLVTIQVTAEDGITQKKYQIKVYRRNEEEEKIAQQKQQEEQVKLSQLLEEKEQEVEVQRLQQEQSEKRDSKRNILILVIIFTILCLAIIVKVRKKYKKKEK